jgi:Mg-chelatase subunit ChlD
MTDRDLCQSVDETMPEVLEGTASDELYDHIAGCDRCRDTRHDAERAAELVVDAAADYVHPEDFELRFEAALSEHIGEPEAGPVDADAPKDAPADSEPEEVPEPHTQGARAAVTGRGPATDPVPKIKTLPPAEPSMGLLERLRRPRNTVAVGLVAAALVAAVVALVVRPEDPKAPTATADSPWKGSVSKIARAAGGEGGLEICVADACAPATEGAKFEPGSVLKTDDRTRAYLELDDGTRVALDRRTELSFDAGADRAAKLATGALVAEVAKVPGQSATIVVPLGKVEVIGTKLALRTTGDSTAVDVSRGVVRLMDEQERAVEVRAGEEGRLYRGSPPYATAAPSLGEGFSWSETSQEQEVAVRGLGELKAKKPGEDDERQGAVRLASHKVKVRIVDGFARTEVEEVFTNTTGDVLEGIYRFPMPQDAQIERLALEVDDHFEEGAFVDRDRAAAIWRGAIVNASTRRPRTREEIIWVPGPWKDPALLEWQRGGRFELRIFPIPAKGSRKVVLTYTQVVQPSAGTRRYVYPLAHDPSGELTVDTFDVDVQVRGHDAARGIQTAGYALSRSQRGDAESLAMSATSFVPTGDLVVEYATAAVSELSAWAYAPVRSSRPDSAQQDDTKTEAKASNGVSKDANAQALRAVEDERPYVAMTLRPKLPRWSEEAQRAYVFVVDASRSMYGERFKRASTLASRVVSELDRLDRFTVMACDTSCRTMAGGLRAPSHAAAGEAQSFLAAVTPEGGSDPTAALREAAAFASRAEGRVLRIVYIGDGTPTVGPIRPSYLTRAVRESLPAGAGTVTAVAIGADSDSDALGAMVRGGGGSVLPYAPGQTVAEAAYGVLGATYGTGLRDVRVELPPGLVEVAPRILDTVVAGGETIVVARMEQPSVSGNLVLRGKVGDKDFEQTYPLTVTATSDAGNAFVPRLYAAARIADLERETTAAARQEAVALSGAFNVASRHTSLLVLESPAMFKAFGLDNSRRVAEWTGETGTLATRSGGERQLADNKERGADKDAYDMDAPSADRDFGFGLDEIGVGGGGKREARKGDGFSAGPPAKPAGTTAAPPAEFAQPQREPPPVPAPAPAPMARPRNKPKSIEKRPATGGAFKSDSWNGRLSSGFVPMRKVFERQALIDTGRLVPRVASGNAIAEAEAELARNDNRRGVVKKLYTLYALAGELDRAQALAERWSEKEALDPEALTARADLAARRGQRDEAIRILGSVVDVRPGDIPSQQRLARLHRWSGRETLGCRHAIAIAQIRERDAKLLAAAVSCGRRTGESRLVDDMLSGADDKTRSAAQRIVDKDKAKADKARGEVRLTATWEGGQHDVDIALIHPDGHRVSWLGAATKAIISAEDVQSLRRESLGLLGSKAGEYVIEVVRASGEGPVRGELVVNAAGNFRKIPFTLHGQRLSLGTLKVFWRSRLVPF